MRKARAEKSPRAEVLLRLREIETLCLRMSETSEHMSLRTVGHVLNDVMLALPARSSPGQDRYG